MHPSPDDQPFDGDLHPGTPDVGGLRRRVLLTGVLALAAWFGALVILDALGLGPWFAVLAAVILHVVLIRPLMRPVREAIALRRRLAFQAWLDSRDDDGDGPVGRDGDGDGRHGGHG
jgi:hypothetical protein